MLSISLVYNAFFCSIQDPYAALLTKYPLLLRKLWDKSANIEASLTQKETVLFGGCLHFWKLSEEENI